MTASRVATARAVLAGAAVFVVLGLALIGVLAALFVPDFIALHAEDQLASYERRTDLALLLAGVLAAVPAGAVTSLLASRAALDARPLLALAAPVVLGVLYLLTSDVSALGRLAGLVLLPIAALAGHALAIRLTEPSEARSGSSV